MKKFLTKLYNFTTSWTGTIIIVLLLVFFGFQSFVIPSGSMKRTLLVGDFLFAKKFSYGISIPELPIIGLKILPDINGNGHLIEGDRPKREDIVIFYVPTNKKQHFVKRCVAVGGDELIYYDKHLLIHFHEGDEFIKKNYPKKKIVKAMGKLWVVNPYKDKYPGIQYQPEYDSNSFLQMIYRGEKEVDMKPVYIEDLDAPIINYGIKPLNAFYKKVSPDHFYMMGDNRDNSDDSRFWGEVPYSLIIGKPWFTWMSIEFRDYNWVAKGGANKGRDHALLKKVCKGSDILSKECEKKWNRYRFTIRWERMFRNISKMQLEEPTR